MSDRIDKETLFYERTADGVAQLTLNRPQAGNGVVPELARDLIQAMNELEADKSLRVLVLTGAGKVFCSGADLNAFKHYLEERLPIEQEPFNMRVLMPVTERLVACRFPLIAALNGAATAGGLDLAMACDMRIASSQARFGETYIKLGLNPGNGGSYFLPRLVGSGLAAELSFTGDLIDAQRALDIGLVNRVVELDQVLETANELAARIARYPRMALEATKHQLRQSWHMDLRTAMNTAFWGVTAMSHSPDLKEGVQAGLDKRAPEYNKTDPTS